MSVREIFNLYKKEIKHAYEYDYQGLLEISQRNVNELLDEFYLDRKLESFYFLNEFSSKDISDFYSEECRDIEMFSIARSLSFCDNTKTADFIRLIKHNTVEFKLFNELVDFISRLKNEKLINN